MPYNPSSDFVGLWRAISGGVEKAEMPGLDFTIAAMTRAGLMRTVTSQTAPTVNQSTTAWFQPAAQSFASEGTLFLWDPSLNVYVPATPELFHGGSSGGGGDGGGGTDMVIISGTQPSNPTAGQEWWNGTILQLWDGVNWKTVGPAVNAAGTPIAPTTLTFSIGIPTDITMPANAWTIVPFNATPSVDTGAGWDGITHKFTPKKPGIYVFNTRYYQSSGTGATGFQLARNDPGSVATSSVDIVSVNFTASASATSGWLTATDLAMMNGTTDYVRLYAYNAGTVYNIGGLPAMRAWLLP